MTVIFLHLLLEELISTAAKAASGTSRGLGKIYRAITYVSLNFIPSQCNSSSTSRVDENCLCRSVDSSSAGSTSPVRLAVHTIPKSALQSCP